MIHAAVPAYTLPVRQQVWKQTSSSAAAAPKAMKWDASSSHRLMRHAVPPSTTTPRPRQYT